MTDETEPAPFDFLKVGAFGRRKKEGPDKKYATFNRRMMAGTLDSLLLLFATPIINDLVPIKDISVSMDGSDPLAAQHALMHVITDPSFIVSWFANLMAQMLLFCLFSGVCWHYWSATPGKMLLRIKIVDANTEQRITDQQIFLRLFGYFVSSLFLLIGFFWIGFDKRRQGWHDKIADTVVVVVPWSSWKKNSDG